LAFVVSNSPFLVSHPTLSASLPNRGARLSANANGNKAAGTGLGGKLFQRVIICSAKHLFSLQSI